jgi:hypothetical protein
MPDESSSSKQVMQRWLEYRLRIVLLRLLNAT